MNCSEIKIALPLYADGALEPHLVKIVEGHLDFCPVCRSRQSEFAGLADVLRRAPRPALPVSLRTNLRRSVRAEIYHQKTSFLPFSSEFVDYLRLRVMPYAVGSAMSVIIGLTVLVSMFTRPYPDAASNYSGSSSFLLASNRGGFSSSSLLSPTEFAGTRFDVSSESPSINPQGALAALTRSLAGGKVKEDEVVVVADVFSDGLAQVAEVVQTSRDRHAVAELERALASDDRRHSPFVAADVDRRSENVRVVLRIQNVNVPVAPDRNRR